MDPYRAIMAAEPCAQAGPGQTGRITGMRTWLMLAVLFVLLISAVAAWIFSRGGEVDAVLEVGEIHAAEVELGGDPKTPDAIRPSQSSKHPAGSEIATVPFSPPEEPVKVVEGVRLRVVEKATGKPVP